jgi:hypothetical protein
MALQQLKTLGIAGPAATRSAGIRDPQVGQMRAFYLAWREQKISQTLSGESSNAINFSAIRSISSTISSVISSALSAQFALPWSDYVREAP